MKLKTRRETPPPPPPSATTSLFSPHSGDIQSNHPRAQTAEAELRGGDAEHVLWFLIRHAVCNRRAIMRSVCSGGTHCWFLKWDGRGLSVETAAEQFPVC